MGVFRSETELLARGKDLYLFGLLGVALVCLIAVMVRPGGTLLAFMPMSYNGGFGFYWLPRETQCGVIAAMQGAFAHTVLSVPLVACFVLRAFQRGSDSCATEVSCARGTTGGMLVFARILVLVGVAALGHLVMSIGAFLVGLTIEGCWDELTGALAVAFLRAAAVNAMLVGAVAAEALTVAFLTSSGLLALLLTLTALYAGMLAYPSYLTTWFHPGAWCMWTPGPYVAAGSALGYGNVSQQDMVEYAIAAVMISVLTALLRHTWSHRE